MELRLSESLAITVHLLVETFPFLCPKDDVFDRQHFRFRHGLVATVPDPEVGFTCLRSSGSPGFGRAMPSLKDL